MLHGVIPGPLILKEHPEVFWGVITSMYIGNIMLLILNVPLIGVFVKILEVPWEIISPLIVLICVIGAYSLNNNSLEVIFMMIFGILGYLSRKFDYEPAPLILAFVIGPMLEKSLRQSLIISGGNLSIFFLRPISLVLMTTTLLTVLSYAAIWVFKKTAVPLNAHQNNKGQK
jgi:putative tricarboxylic transport membrane protein